MAKKESPKTKHGKLTRAGQLLSQFVRSIALEETELVKGVDGEDQMASKAEALARLIWKKALGYTEQKVIDGKLTDIDYPPDRTMMAMVFDRMEGRAPLMNPEKGNKRTIADKVSEQGKRRIKEIAESSLTS